MNLEYKRNIVSDNISYSVIRDTKFKTNTWKVKFAADLSKIERSALSIAAAIITSCNSEEKTMALLNSKLNNLYGADLFSSFSKRGDIAILTVGVSVIDNIYALDNENLAVEAVNLLLKSIFSPLIENNGFGKEIFDIKKSDLLDSISAEINDKRRYLYLKSYEKIFANEPAAFPLYGTQEEAMAVTPESALNAYKDFIKNSVKEIFFEGTTVYPETEKMITDAFLKSDSNEKINLCFDSDIITKDTVCEATENLNVSQSKFLIAFKNKSVDKYTMRMLSIILGGIPSSKLFTNVREKQSLCYYCTSSYIKSKNTLIIDCGVESGNEQKAIDAVLEQFEEMKKGNITDDEMNAALLAFDNSLKGTGDVPGSYINWYFESFCSGEYITPDISSKRYHAVTVEMIKNAALSLIKDTVYIIKPDTKES